MKAGGKIPQAKRRRGSPPDWTAPADVDLWHEVAKSVAPLPPKAKREARARREPGEAVSPAGPPERKTVAPKRPGAVPAPKPPVLPRPSAPPPLTPRSAPGLDARSFERLRRGQLPIEATIDLHGHTLEEAHRALGPFLEEAHARGKRCVLVITGKGSGKRGEEEFGAMRRATLREKVPAWLNEQPTRGRILAFVPAQPKHGGAGALYLLLKRRRA
jgi:DNA-nicking Smr family endonuclease